MIKKLFSYLKYYKKETILAALIPFPKLETTPPVTKINFILDLSIKLPQKQLNHFKLFYINFVDRNYFI